MRILSLDWDSAFQRDLTLELGAAGHQVELLSRVAEALTCDAERPFDLIVSETRLPDKNGLHFLRELRSARERAGLEPPAVVVLTEVEDQEIGSLCRAEGALRVLHKKDGWPTVVAELHGVIAELDPAPSAPTAPDSARPDARIFRGNLETIEILDIVQLLNLGRKTGLLVLSGGMLDGRIALDQGEIVDARYHEESGVMALGSLLTVKRGSFRFEAGAFNGTRTINQPTSSLLLEALRLHDEGTRHAYGGAPGSEEADHAANRGEAFDFEHREEADSADWLLSGLAEDEAYDEGAAPSEPSRAGGKESGLPLFEAPIRLPDAPGDHVEPALDPFALPEPPAKGVAPADPRTIFAPAPSAPITPPASPAPRPVEPRAFEPETWPRESHSAGRPDPGPRTVLLKGAAPDRRRRPRVSRTAAALVGAGAIAVLASGYVVFFSDMVHGPAEELKSADYRSLMLEAAASQSRIDSLEQILHGLSQSVQSGDVSQADAEQRISALRSEIQKASADLDTARRAADAGLDGDRGGEAREKQEPTPRVGLLRESAAAPFTAAPASAAEGRAPRTPDQAPAPLVAAPSSAGDSGIARGDPSAVDSVRPAEATVEVVSVDVAARNAPDASSAGRDSGGAVPEPESAAGGAPAADYSLAAIRRAPTFVPVDVRASPRTPIRPQYPPALAARAIGGTVTLWTLVNASGRVEDVRVLRSSGQPELDKAASDAIRRTVYNPARRDDVAVPTWTQQQIAFKLD
ncbi:MAG TPA: TonB family protein [Gemmatimonadota bacterium]